jgi:DNA-directed RNA polymerase subunit alpha
MNMLECIEFRQEKNLSSLPVFYGKFLLSDLQKGQGLTVANTLRRILLHEVPAVGITSVFIRPKKTEGMNSPNLPQGFHEFSTLPFLKESVLEILFNLRSIIFRTNFPYDSPQKVLLDFEEENQGEIQAKNLRLPPQIDLIFPNQYIGRVNQTTSNFPFIFECTLEKIFTRESSQTGIDKPTELLTKKTIPKNTFVDESKNILQNRRLLPIGGNIFPVKKVNYTIEMDSLEKEMVFFEIWTNGALSPQEVFDFSIEKTLMIFQKFHPDHRKLDEVSR